MTLVASLPLSRTLVADNRAWINQAIAQARLALQVRWRIYRAANSALVAGNAFYSGQRIAVERYQVQQAIKDYQHAQTHGHYYKGCGRGYDEVES